MRSQRGSMRSRWLLVCCLCASPAATAGCGGASGQEAKSAHDAEEASDPMAELKSLSGELDSSAGDVSYR